MSSVRRLTTNTDFEMKMGLVSFLTSFLFHFLSFSFIQPFSSLVKYLSNIPFMCICSIFQELSELRGMQCLEKKMLKRLLKKENEGKYKTKFLIDFQNSCILVFQVRLLLFLVLNWSCTHYIQLLRFFAFFNIQVPVSCSVTGIQFKF